MTHDPFRSANDEAHALARQLLQEARFGALGVLINGLPFVTRIALAPDTGGMTTLVSDLAPHTAAIRKAPQASLMIGEPGKGDPLAYPRMTLAVTAQFIDKTEPAQADYLTHQPKAQLYIGFGDFHLVRLTAESAHLNGGFGKAYRLEKKDLDQALTPGARRI